MSKIISNIVFTKNRPLQLDGYLDSLHRHMSGEQVQTYIIYKVDQFDEQYSEVFARFSDCIVVREKDFHDDFMDVFEKIDTEYMLFGTDDVVYYDSVGLAFICETFDRFSSEIFGFTLKFGPDSLKDTSDSPIEVEASQNLFKVNWRQAKDRDARYPFEVNSTIYKTALVRKILSHVAKERPLLKKLFARDSARVKFLSRIVSVKNFLAAIDTFRDPNTLEGYCYRWCKTHKREFPSYLYFQKLCASTLQINIVNTSVPNPVYGTDAHTVNTLNEKFKKGYRLDIETIEKNKPKSLLVGHAHFKLKCSQRVIE